jgi:hypothetical protein
LATNLDPGDADYSDAPRNTAIDPLTLLSSLELDYAHSKLPGHALLQCHDSGGRETPLAKKFPIDLTAC